MSDITLAQLEATFRSAAKSIDAAVAPVVVATAGKVADTQRANIAVRTGRTRDSIAATAPDGSALGARSTEAVIGPRKPWAHVGRWIELGTVTQGPRVYVANSYDPHRADHERAVAEAMISGLWQ